MGVWQGVRIARSRVSRFQGPEATVAGHLKPGQFAVGNADLPDFALNHLGFSRLGPEGLAQFPAERCNFGVPIKHGPCPSDQDDLRRPRLVDMIDLRHELVS